MSHRKIEISEAFFLTKGYFTQMTWIFLMIHFLGKGVVCIFKKYDKMDKLQQFLVCVCMNACIIFEQIQILLKVTVKYADLIFNGVFSTV